MLKFQKVIKNKWCNLEKKCTNTLQNRILLPISFMCLLFAFYGCNKNLELENLEFVNERGGCANFLLYTAQDEMFSLTVSGNRDSLGLSLTAQQYNLPNSYLNITINEFENKIGNFYCDDIVGDEGKIINSYEAISGKAEIYIASDTVVFEQQFYEITVKLTDLEFEINGVEKVFKELNFDNITVGWLPG